MKLIPNCNTLARMMEELGFDPLQKLVKIYNNPATSRKTKVRIETALRRYGIDPATGPTAA